MKKIALTTLVLAALGAAPASAQSWYFGGGVGAGNFNMSGQDLTNLTGLQNASVDKSDTTYTLRTGYKFTPNIALELGYYDLGKYSYSGKYLNTDISGSVKAKSVGMSVVGIAPLSASFDLYARIGYARSELKANANTALSTASDSEKQNEATYGLGAHYYFNKQWGLFAEWMKNDKIKVDSYLFGVDVLF